MRAAALATVLLSGCTLFTLFEPVLPPISDKLQVVDATDVWSVPTDARMPTDVAALNTGGFGILDGYRQRALLFDADHSFQVEVAITNDFGAPVRAARASDGASWWFTVPEADGLIRVAPSGEVLQSFQLMDQDGQILGGPVAVYDEGERLVVGLHDGSVVFADPASGAVLSKTTKDAEGDALGAITDISADGSGHLLVTDGFGARVNLLDADGTALTYFGHFGLWAGSLAKPKAVVPGPDGTVLVADTQLRAVQLFEGDGTFLGVIAQTDGTKIPFEHPIALEALEGGRFLALDARTAVLWGFTIDDAAIAAAREEAHSARHLRTALADLDQDAQLASGELCFQCHDGTIQDNRANWDPDLGHHPVGVVPHGAVPPFFPLVDGRVVCTTCHSPHGTVSASTAAGATEGERVELIRHAPVVEADLFTRVSRTDSALCVACHTDAAHETALADVGGTGSNHPTGDAMKAALAKRGGAPGQAGLPAGVDGTCLTCHAVHAARKGNGILRDEDDEVECLACHAAKGDATRNHPLHKPVQALVGDEDLTLDPVGQNTCRTCHNLVGGRTEALLAIPASGGLLCLTCHDPKILAGPHGEVKGARDIPCLGCHDVHGGQIEHHLVRTLAAATDADPTGCLSCHGKGGVAYVAAISPGVKGHPVAGGDQTCLTCHEEPHDPGHPPACGTCHEEQQAAADRGGHGSATCAQCHPPHSDPPTLSAALTPKGAHLNPKTITCLACHAVGTAAEAPKVASFEHPAPVFTPGGARWEPLAALPLFAADGSMAPSGENGDLTCSSCHVTHGPDATKPGDHLRRPGWEEACAACHGDQGLMFYRFFHDPAARARMGVSP